MTRTTVSMTLQDVSDLMVQQALAVARTLFAGKNVVVLESELPTWEAAIYMIDTETDQKRIAAIVSEYGLVFANSQKPEGLEEVASWDEVVAFCRERSLPYADELKPWGELVTFLAPWASILQRVREGDESVYTEPVPFYMVKVADLEDA